MKILKGDNVMVTVGKDRGKSGKVSRTLPNSNKVVVEGLNVIKRHRRPRRQGEQGQRVEIATPLFASNVMVICPSCGKNTRIEYRVEGKEKVRVCKKCKAAVVAK